MTARSRVGASLEGIKHHIDQHPCYRGLSEQELRDCNEVTCPCGNAIALVCNTCGEVLFLIVRPGTWCKHAEQMYREVGS